MTLTRPRLIAGLLCLLLVLAVALLFAFGRIGPNVLHRSADEALKSFDVQEEPPPGIDVPANDAPAVRMAPTEPGAPAEVSPIAVNVPRIAYTYGYSFRLDRDRIAAVQENHLALCRRLGPALCRVTAMQRGGTPDGDAGASLKLQVSASLAEGFGRDLVAIAGAGGGETADRSIAAEDLSPQMIDSAARIRTREVLIQRLTGLLQTRSGNIAQAVEAERAINDAQEELEAARASLADMQGRVAMSAVEIAYVARGAAPASANPIGRALDQVASAASGSVGAMILILGIFLPWAMVGGLLVLAVRTVRRRREKALE
jgi:hypothetical protein